MWKNKLEGPTRQKRAAGEAYKTIFWPTSSLKQKTLDTVNVTLDRQVLSSQHTHTVGSAYMAKKDYIATVTTDMGWQQTFQH